VVSVDDDAIRILVKRLARPHASGGDVIERSVILAEGSDFAEVLAWIAAHDGAPDATPASRRRRGLHGAQVSEVRVAASAPPLRYVLPAGALV
jgi:hypothetical protein